MSEQKENPWPKLIGKYKDDPTWEGFDDFLRDSREEADRVYRESETERPSASTVERSERE